MLRNATTKIENEVKRRIFAANCNKGRDPVKKDRLKAEIERIEEIQRNKHSYFIRQELKRYLKYLKWQLKKAEKDE